MSGVSENSRGVTIISAIRSYNLVLIVSLLWFMVQFLRFVFPPLFLTIQETYNVSNAETGVLFTLLMIGYSLVQFPSGWLADRFDEPIVILVGVVLFTLASLSVFVAPTFALLTVAAIFIGIGTGVHKTVAIPFLSRTYPERTGFSLGVMDTIGQFGGMMAPIVVVAIISSALWWRYLFVFGAVVSVGLGAIFWVMTTSVKKNEGTKDASAEGSDSSTEAADDLSYLSVFSDRHLLLYLVVTMLFTFSWNGIAAFFPLFLTGYKGFPPSTAGMLYSLLFVASLSQTVTGFASDTFHRLNIAIILFGSMILGLIGILFVSSILSIILVTLLVGVGFHGFRPVRDSYLMDQLPSTVDGGSLGIVRTGMTMIGAFSPAIIGFLADVAGFVTAFSLIIATLGLGALLLIILR